MAFCPARAQLMEKRVAKFKQLINPRDRAQLASYKCRSVRLAAAWLGIVGFGHSKADELQGNICRNLFCPKQRLRRTRVPNPHPKKTFRRHQGKPRVSEEKGMSLGRRGLRGPLIPAFACMECTGYHWVRWSFGEMLIHNPLWRQR